MTWQSDAIAAVQLMFAVVLWPTIRDSNAAVPRKTSVPTALGLWAIAAVYISLNLWSAVVMAGLTAIAWSFVAVFRPIREAAA